MRRQLVSMSGALVAGLTLMACQMQVDEATKKKLDEISTKLDALDKKVGQGARPMPQQPAGPDPSTVYSVAVDGSAYDGPQHAKVTIVEAFEFA